MSGIIGASASVSGGVPAEFSNVTGQTLPNLQTGVALATAASGEALRVRDVAITQTVTRPWRLRLGSTPLLTGSGNAILAGDEVVVPGSPLTIDTLDMAIFNRFAFFTSGGDNFNVTTPTIFGSDRPTALTGTAVSANFSPALNSGSTNFACIGANSDFYYYDRTASNTTPLFRRAGGINGAESTVSSGRADCCYDGSRYIYAIDNTSFQEVDTLTGTVSATINFSGAVTNLNITSDWYNHSAALDRYFVIRTGGSNNYTVYLVNGQTGVTVSLGTPSGTATSQRLPVAFNRLSNNDYVAHVIFGTGTLRINLGPNLASPTSQTTAPSYATSGLTNSSTNTSVIIPIQSARNHLVQLLANTSGHSILNLDTGVFVMSAVSSSSISGTTPLCWYLRPLDAASANTDFGTTAARTTGERFKV